MTVDLKPPFEYLDQVFRSMAQVLILAHDHFAYTAGAIISFVVGHKIQQSDQCDRTRDNHRNSCRLTENMETVRFTQWQPQWSDRRR